MICWSITSRFFGDFEECHSNFVCHKVSAVDKVESKMGLFGLFALMFGIPIGILRYFFKPAFDRANERYESYKNRTQEGVTSAKELAFKLAVVTLAAVVIIWLAVFMYIAFYYTYMPSVAHIRPVHMQFK